MGWRREKEGELSNESLLFVSCSNRSQGKRLTYWGIRHVMDDLAEKTGIDLHSHRGRHTFAITIVDELDPETRTAIKTTNLFDLRVDMLWYEIPVVYELSQQKLYFYDQPTNFFEQFKGEIVWKQLRSLIKQILAG